MNAPSAADSKQAPGAPGAPGAPEAAKVSRRLVAKDWMREDGSWYWTVEVHSQDPPARWEYVPLKGREFPSYTEARKAIEKEEA